MSTRVTLDLDGPLLDEARRLTGLEEPATVIHAGLQLLIARESARRLAQREGSQPKLRSVPRRRIFGE